MLDGNQDLFQIRSLKSEILRSRSDIVPYRSVSAGEGAHLAYMLVLLFYRDIYVNKKRVVLLCSNLKAQLGCRG